VSCSGNISGKSNVYALRKFDKEPEYLWRSVAELAQTHSDDKDELLRTLEKAFSYIENKSFSTAFDGLFSEIKLCHATP
jgi:hypothetical protein